jgi:hypothetical protein
MAPRIFISYRRQDSRGDAGRIYDRLRPEFGEANLFMDVTAIPLGVNFVKVLREEVARCDVLLAVIGPTWLDARDDDGARRLDNANDFVRVEVGAALQRDIPVIPVLLEGTRMPRIQQLPGDLHELAQRNALDVRHTSFHADMDKLVAGLKAHPTAASAAAAKVLTPQPLPTATVTPSPPRPVAQRPLVASVSSQFFAEPSSPTAVEAIANAGRWVSQLGVELRAEKVPLCFSHCFMRTVGPRTDSDIQHAPGTIVTGMRWDGSDFPFWTIVHGHHGPAKFKSLKFNVLTYLGPAWRPEYARLSDEVFKLLGGKPLAHFIKHP